MELSHFRDSDYLAVKGEFILKVDGSRPIIYSLDAVDTAIYFLSPIEGLALSLLDGVTPFEEARRYFDSLFPQSTSTYADILQGIDARVRNTPSKARIGQDGLIEVSDSRIEGAQSYDPRSFVISPDDYMARFRDIKTALRLDTPINIYTIFTHRCLTDCIYCYADRTKMIEMPLARWREIIRDMRKLGIWLCVPDNGDTFARRDGIELLECLLEHEMIFMLSTKAHVSKEQVRRLMDAGFMRKVRGAVSRCVQLSVDAADEAVSKTVLNINRPRTQENLDTFDNFLSFGVMPKIKAVITSLNIDQPKRIVDLFYPRGARIFHFIRYVRSFHRHTDDLFVEPEHLPTLRQQISEIREKYPDIDLVENLTEGAPEPYEDTKEAARKRWEARAGCGGGWSTLGILPNGKAFLCEQMKMAEPFFVGDVQTQSIEEIWHGQQLLNFIHPGRELFASTVCHSCGEFEKCIWEKGRCYRDAYFSYGSIHQPPPLCPKNLRPGLRMS